MRVLVVDQDSALLTAITRLLGEYFTVDAVTTKADCQDLLRRNEYDVIVAGERLGDGSGLELLSQMAQSRPDMLRIFTAEPERLRLLRGRLGPFRLFRTLSYPIEPRQLVAALSAAAGVDEDEEEEATAHEDTVPAPAPTRAVPELQIPTRVSAVVTAAVLGHAGRSAAADDTAEVAPSPARDASDRQRSRTRSSPRNADASDPASRGDGGGSSTAARSDSGGVPNAPPTRGGSRSASPAARGAPVTRSGNGRGSTARAANRPEPATGSARSRRARQPTPEALALGARLAAHGARLKSFAPPSLEASAKRSAFAIGAGVALAVGAVLLTFMIFSPPALHTSTLTNTQSPSFPPEVLKLVADTETAFQLDDLKGARTDIAALQQIAPAHPGLPFFEAELKRRQAEAAASKPPAVPPPNDSAPRHPAPKATHPPISFQTAATRRRPAEAGVTFSGTTLEDSSTGSSGSSIPQTPSANRSRTPPSASAVMNEPRVIHRVRAEYPQEAARDGVEGAVDLSFSISKRGDVYDVTVVHAEPSSIFNRAAIAAVRRWKYEPKTVDGIPVESRVQVRLTFKLDDR
jgi:protein TonB